MKEVMIVLLISLVSNQLVAAPNDYPPHLECKTGLCKDEIYKRAVKVYCTNEEERNPELKAQEWGPYFLKLGGGCWCSCSRFR